MYGYIPLIIYSALCVCVASCVWVLPRVWNATKQWTLTELTPEVNDKTVTIEITRTHTHTPVHALWAKVNAQFGYLLLSYLFAAELSWAELSVLRHTLGEPALSHTHTQAQLSLGISMHLYLYLLSVNPWASLPLVDVRGFSSFRDS